MMTIWSDFVLSGQILFENENMASVPQMNVEMRIIWAELFSLNSNTDPLIWIESFCTN